MSHHSLKELKTSRAKLNAEKDRLNIELNTCNKRLAEVNKKIQLATKEPVVSEHAVLRYIERKLGIDTDEIKNEILSDKTIKHIRHFGSGKFPIGQGMYALVKQNVVVSVVD